VRVSAGSGVPFVSANIRAHGTRIAPPMIRLERGGLRIAILGVFEPPSGTEASPEFAEHSGELEVDDPLERLPSLVASLRNSADVIVALGRLSPGNVRKLIERCPEIDVVISTAFDAPLRLGAQAPPSALIKDDDGFLGGTLVLYTDIEGYGVGIADLTVDDQGRITSAQRRAVFLDESVQGDPRVARQMARFYDEAARRLVAGRQGPARGIEAPGFNLAEAVGDRACAACHASEHAQWATSPHGRAHRPLLEWHRQYGPECLRCHDGSAVAGSEPTAFPIEARLMNVQCEQCHGAGAGHARAPQVTKIARTIPTHVCVQCHDPGHSPRFDYESSYRKAAHTGADRRAAAGTEIAGQ